MNAEKDLGDHYDAGGVGDHPPGVAVHMDTRVDPSIKNTYDLLSRIPQHPELLGFLKGVKKGKLVVSAQVFPGGHAKLIVGTITAVGIATAGAIIITKNKDKIRSIVRKHVRKPNK